MKIKGFDIEEDIAEFEKQINEFLTGVTMKDIVIEKHTYNRKAWYKAAVKYEENVHKILKVKLFNKKPFLEMITDAQAFMDTVNVIDVKFLMSNDDDNKFVVVIYDENRGEIPEGAEMGIEIFRGDNIEALNNEIDIFGRRFNITDAQIAGYKETVNVMLNYTRNDSTGTEAKVFYGSTSDTINQINEFMPDIKLLSLDYVDCNNNIFAFVLTYQKNNDGEKSVTKIKWLHWENGKEKETLDKINEFINSGVKILNIRMKNINKWYSVLFVYEDNEN